MSAYAVEQTRAIYDKKHKAPFLCGKEALCEIRYRQEIRYYSLYFFTIMLALCPPKPNVFDSATLISRFCALLNVKFNL